MDNKWHYRFLELAELVSTWSKDTSTKVGAVAVHPVSKIVCGFGYNGMPRGVDDDIEYRSFRPEKYMWYEHGERNLCYNAARMGVCLNGCYIYVTHFPCPDCARGIVQSGFSEIYYIVKDTPEWIEFNNRMLDVFARSWIILSEGGVKITPLFVSRE